MPEGRHCYVAKICTPRNLNDSWLADAKLVFGNRVIHVHRVILARNSRYFRCAFLGPFEESHTREIQLPEDQYDIYYLMLALMYSGPYTENGIYSMRNLKLDNIFEFYTVADYIQAETIKTAVRERMMDLLYEASTELQRDLNPRRNLKDLCQSASKVIPQKDTELHNIYVATTSLFKKYLGPLHYRAECVQGLFAEFPEFAHEILAAPDWDELLRQSPGSVAEIAGGEEGEEDMHMYECA